MIKTFIWTQNIEKKMAAIYFFSQNVMKLDFFGMFSIFKKNIGFGGLRVIFNNKNE